MESLSCIMNCATKFITFLSLSAEFLPKLFQEYKNIKQFGSRLVPMVCLAYYGYNMFANAISRLVMR